MNATNNDPKNEPNAGSRQETHNAPAAHVQLPQRAQGAEHPAAPVAPAAHPQLSPDDSEADEIAARRAGQIVENIIQSQQSHRGGFIPTQGKPPYPSQGGGKGDRNDRGDRNRGRRRRGRDRDRPMMGQGQGQGQGGKDRDRNRPQSGAHGHPGHFQSKPNSGQPRHDNRDSSRAMQRHNPQPMKPGSVHSAAPSVHQAQPIASPGPHAPGATIPPVVSASNMARSEAPAFPFVQGRPVQPTAFVQTRAPHSFEGPPASEAPFQAPEIHEAAATAIELSSFGSESVVPIPHEQIIDERLPAPALEAPAHSSLDEVESGSDRDERGNYAESMADEATGVYEHDSPTVASLDAIDVGHHDVVRVDNEGPAAPEMDALATAPLARETGTESASAFVAHIQVPIGKAGPINPRQKTSRNWRESTYESSTVAPQPAPSTVRKVVLLNSTEPGEIRVAILENGELAEIFMERKSHYQQAGNIYKGRVVNVEPSLQAAFIDLGAERNGFLHASDVIPPNGGYADVLDKKIHDKGRQRQFDKPGDQGPRPQREQREPRENRDQYREGREKGATPPSVLAARNLSAATPQVCPQTPGNSDFVADGPLLLNRPARPSPRQSVPYAGAGRPQSPAYSQPSALNVPPDANAPDGSAETELPAEQPVQGAVDTGIAPVPAGPDGSMPIIPGQPGFDAKNQNRESKRRRRRRGGRGRSGRARVPGPVPMLAPQSKGYQQNPEQGEVSHSNEPQPSQSSPEVAAPIQDSTYESHAAASELPDSAPSDLPAQEKTAAETVVTDSGAIPPVSNDAVDIIDATIGQPVQTQDEAASTNARQAEPDEDEEDNEEDDVDEDEEDQDEEEEESSATSAIPETARQTAHETDESGRGPIGVESTPSAPSSQDDMTDRMDRADELADQLEEDEDHQPVPASREAAPPQEGADAVQTVSEDEQVAQTRSHDAVQTKGDELEGAPHLDADASTTGSISEIVTKTFEPVSAIAIEPVGTDPQRPSPAAPHVRKNNGRKDRVYDRRYTIQEMLREGQEVLVQVAKEGIGQKGPALTTYISLPGRYLVLMPAVSRLGVSKRIDSEEQRRALKEALSQLNPPDDMGVIVRTAGMGRTKDELQRDMEYLMRAWDGLKDKTKTSKAPNLIYQEGDVVTRVFRDVLTEDVTEIVIDDPVVMERAREFLRETSPGSEKKLKFYAEPEPLFHRYNVEQQMQRLFNRKVNLKNGGSIVIEQTEALVAIDVNTGRFREKRNQDDTILQTNLEAAREIARQLRLRDIGGLVMIDFIDMEISEHKRRVERELKSFLARDKAKINVLPVSSLGVVEMTRQRIRHSLKKTLFDRCPHCSGSGHIKSPESIGLEMLREIKAQVRDKTLRKIKVLLNSHVAYGILNQFRKELVRMEEANGITIEVCGDPGVALSQMQVSIAKEGGDWVLKKVSEVDDYVRNS